MAPMFLARVGMTGPHGPDEGRKKIHKKKKKKGGLAPF